MMTVEPASQPTLGVLGGMGPMATVDFLRKLILHTPARTDQEHMPIIVRNVPQIPDRSDAFLNRSDAPWPALLKGLRMLEDAGVQAIAIPCNTAHVWHDRLAQSTPLEVLHIGRSTAEWLVGETPGIKTVGLLATSATIASRIYHEQLEQAGIRVVLPDEKDQAELVMGAIRHVKAGNLDTGRQQLLQASINLMDAKAGDPQALVMACTEIPVALEGVSLPVPGIDSTDILARACVRWWQNATLAHATA